MTDSTDNARGRIWATPYDAGLDGGTYCDAATRPTAPNHDAWCYVRADLAPDPLADARVAGLVDALKQIKMAKFEDGTWQCVAKRQAGIARAALAAFDKGGKDE